MKPTNILFPVGGLHERYAHQQGPVYTTPDCLNVRPYDTLLGRERGGSRPGLCRAFREQLGSGAPVRMMGTVTYVETDGYTFAEDSFAGSTLGSLWSVASWIGTLPSILPDDYADVTFGITAGAVRTALTFDATQPYMVEMLIAPYGGSHNGKYQIFARMDNASPVATTGGIVAELVMGDAVGTYSGSLKVYAGGVLTNTHAFTGGGGSGTPQNGWFTVHISGNNVTCHWNGTQVLASTAVSAAVGSRMGFGMECTVSGGICLTDKFRVQYKTSTKEQVRRQIMVAGANGLLYRETFLGVLEAIGGSVNIASDRYINAAQRGQKLYMADHSNPRHVGSGTSTITEDAGGERLSDSGVANWTALSIDVNNDVAVLSSSSVAANDTTQKITSLAAGYAVLTTTALSAATCSSRIERSPKVYDPSANTVAILFADAGKGSVPSGCPLIAFYRDRLVLAGQPIAPQAWFMSRQGTPTDWLYSDTDAAAATAGTTANAGQVGEALTALIPFNDDFLIFGCTSSLWVMRGDPKAGGSLDNISRDVGIVGGGRAFCFGPQSELIFLSRHGLYMLPPGATGTPTEISRDNLPREMINIDPVSYTVLMAYDHADRGVHIYLTPIADKEQKHFFFDYMTKSFWPVKLTANHEPTSILQYVSPSAEESCVLLGGRNGYIRRYRDEQEDDEGTAFSNHIFLGPIRSGGSDFSDGLLNSVESVLASNSGSVTLSVHVGKTHQASLAASAFKSFTIAAGLSTKMRPRARGASIFLKLTGTTARRWAIERLSAIFEKLGQIRAY